MVKEAVARAWYPNDAVAQHNILEKLGKCDIVRANPVKRGISQITNLVATVVIPAPSALDSIAQGAQTAPSVMVVPSIFLLAALAVALFLPLF